MFTFHIYLGDTCIGDVDAEGPDSALAIYCQRNNCEVEGLTAIYIPTHPSAFRESRPGVPDGSIERRAYADDDDFDVSLRRTPFPPMMLAAGILWIVSGVMLLSLSALSLYLGDSSNIIWTGIGSLFFLKDGVQLLSGSFRDPKADGVLCIAIAGWIFFQGVFRYQATESLVALAVAIVFAGVILIPGILVLVGRQQYLAWQAEKNATSP